ncbi:DegT/DnrJ/EryC1/StrS family aminotransferase [Trueperella sp. LYQ143]|uniref:DegT/DnrJ/EryC1/StrS family aminotransferase n=1 Tax=unclassified Trueperella TaxID=2630174 RepID=UPI003982FCE8
MDLQMIPAAKPIIGEEERQAVDAVLASGMLAQGEQVAAFEEEFATQLTPGADVIAVNSGTSALHIGLLAAGIGAGDEVIVPSFTFAATGNSVALTGARPVFADIELDHYCLDPRSIRESITERTKAIMPVHLYGHPANMTEIRQIADEYGLMIFEDAAQAHGASLHGEMVGTFGTFAAFSLYPTKNMTSGEGGMISTADTDVARRCRLLRNQGMETQYQNELVGLNNRMTNIHAAIGRVQLGKLSGWTHQRQRNAEFLTQNLDGVITPAVAEGAVHVYHQYTIRVEDDRDGFAAALREEYKVGCGVYYPIPNHRLPSLAPYAPGLELPHTETAAQHVISLPVHPSLSQDDLERIVRAVNALAKAGA